MADLDDFFAKKDKKKSKVTKKYTTNDEFVKKLTSKPVDDWVECAKKSDKPKKEQPLDNEDNEFPDPDQNEWKEFEVEKKDYSGLKIGNLVLSSEDENATNADTNIESETMSEEARTFNDGKTGPWKKIGIENVVENAISTQHSSTSQKSASKTYVIPNLRNQQQQRTPVQPSRLRSKVAPDIHNEEYFPTLSKTGDSNKSRNEGTFEVVYGRTASKPFDAAKNQAPKLNLENRFNTLGDNS